jgi:hypothetical protein
LEEAGREADRVIALAADVHQSIESSGAVGKLQEGWGDPQGRRGLGGQTNRFIKGLGMSPDAVQQREIKLNGARAFLVGVGLVGPLAKIRDGAVNVLAQQGTEV